MLGARDLRQYLRDGYPVVRQLFSLDEMEQYRHHFMRLGGQGSYPDDLASIDPMSDDPFMRYLRIIHMQHRDEINLRWPLALHSAVNLMPSAFVPEEA